MSMDKWKKTSQISSQQIMINSKEVEVLGIAID